MDFEFHYTKELEEFRDEVRTFIEENALKEPMPPTGGVGEEGAGETSPELYEMGRELRRKLGAKGWYAPNYPKKYGGGGLDTNHCIVLSRELARITAERRWPGGTVVSGIMTGGIGTYGTEEQKQRFLVPLLRGEIEGWQCFTEPDAGTDEASIKSTAVRDGDAYIINGDKVFVGGGPKPRANFLYWPAITDPKAPRHHNLSAFFIPANLPGIHYTLLDLVSNTLKWEVVCENVRCPADCLIGQENKGWMVMQATLALEHGGGGALVPRNTFVWDFLNYCKKTMRNGQPISRDPVIQDLLVQLYIESNVQRLWGLRNYAMSEGQIQRTRYTGTQTSLHGKVFDPRLGKAILDIIGPLGLVNDPELQVLLGRTVTQIKAGEVTHPGGTPEVQKIMMSRGLGLGRGTQESRH
jgi:hypothetical protein